MKYIYLTFLFLIITTSQCFAMTPPGFKGEVFSDIQNNGYEYINVDGKQHTIPPHGNFCIAEIKRMDLAFKYVDITTNFETGKIVGIKVTYNESTLHQTLKSLKVYPIWVPEILANDFKLALYTETYGKPATYSIICTENVSPKSLFYIKATQSDLSNLKLISK